MQTLTIFSATLFVLSTSGTYWVWTHAVGRDAGPPESMMLIAGVLGFIISLILFGVVFGMMIGARL